MRLVPVALLAALACVLATQAGGSSRADDPASVVTAYAQAIGAHDASTVCKLFSAGVREDIDRVARELGPAATCADIVAWVWSPDEGLAGFTRVDLVSVGTPISRDGLQSVSLSATVTYDTGSAKPVDDTVWLQDEQGVWRVAKPSGLLAVVSHWGDWWNRYGDDPTAEPDLAAYAKLRQHDRDAEAASAAAEEKAWTQISPTPSTCPGHSVQARNRPLGGVAQLWTNGNGIPSVAEGRSVELTRARLARSAGSVCFDIWTRASLAPTAEIEIDLLSPKALAAAQKGRPAPSVALLLTLDGTRGKLRRVTDLDLRKGPFVPARLARSGRRLQIVIRLARAPAPLRANRFAWSLTSILTRAGTDIVFGDRLPRDGRVEFPSGRLFG